jgi:phage tail sheath protein FI
MTNPLSPGVYVLEVPSAIQPIAGVGTSTAAFIGVVPDSIDVPVSSVASEQIGVGDGATTMFKLAKYPVLTDQGFSVWSPAINESIGKGDGATKTFTLGGYPVLTAPGTFAIKVNGSSVAGAALNNVDGNKVAQVVFTNAPAANAAITGSYYNAFPAITVTNPGDLQIKVTGEQVGAGDGKTLKFSLSRFPVVTQAATYTVKVGGTTSADATLVNLPGGQGAQVAFSTAPAAGNITVDYEYIRPGVEIQNDDVNRVAQVKFSSAPGAQPLFAAYMVGASFAPIGAGQVKLCTNFTDFTKSFGGFSTDQGQSYLAHAVYGFFSNGGTLCYVVRQPTIALLQSSLDALLSKLEAIDGISIVAAPGITDKQVCGAIVALCENTGDRFAILDSPEDIGSGDDFDPNQLNPSNTSLWPGNSSYAAFYMPWLKVYDPAKQIQTQGVGHTFVPPSGHIAGIYARVDAQRGVYKAPANEVVADALGLRYSISKSQQDLLNPQGVNCIRYLNGDIRVWGARTIGGDANEEWKYINVRRVFLFLRDSIDQGTQWVVFEPNDTSLWAKIRRNVTAFLTNVWRSGALFGDTAQEAFFVKCDAENNPPEVCDLGQVIIDIGVAIVRPAEFVIFRISQWEGPTNS